MLASTFYDPVIGVDIHIVLVPAPPAPAPVPTPVPMPFVGLVFDPAGMLVGMAISAALGGGPGLVLVNGLPATNCGTEATLLLTSPHLPAPGVAFAKGLPGNDAELFLGSLDVSFAGSFAVRLGDIALSCSDPIRLPTSVVLALPKGAPVLVVRPPVPDLAAIAMAIAMRAGMAALRALARRGARLFRALRRMQHASPRWAALSRRIGNVIDRIAPRRLRSRLRRGVCHLTGHPVDVATGRVLTDAVDFELRGPVPFSFYRSYDSSLSWRETALGRGWSHSLDQAVWEERGKVVCRGRDGREIEFHLHDRPGRVILEGESLYHAGERLTLRRLKGGRWRVETASGRRYTFAPVEGAPPTIAKLVDIRGRGDTHRIELSYDAAGMLSVVRDSGGRRFLFRHDEAGRLTKVLLPTSRGDGHYTHRRFEYDEQGDLIAVEDAMKGRWSFEYVTHLLVRETNRNGLSFYFQYDGFGDGARCVRTWGDGGIYDHVISYDTANAKTMVEDSVGATTVYAMDDQGHVVSVMDTFGHEMRFEYDPETGHRSAEVNPLGHETRWTYDARGFVARIDNPNGSSIAVERDDVHDGPLAVTDANGVVWRWEYDEVGRVVAAINPYGHRSEYIHHEGRIAQTRTPGGAVTSYEYDAEGNVATVHTPDGETVRLRYDAQGRVVKTSSELSPGRTRVETFEYDAEGRTTRTAMPHAEMRRSFDAEGNVIGFADGVRDVELIRGGFNRMMERREAGTSVRFEYDSEQRLVAVINEAGERLERERDRRGLTVAQTFFDGARERYEFDAYGQLVGLERASGRSEKFSYDAGGQVTRIDRTDGSFEEFEYRADGQMTKATNADAVVHLDRDEVGRITRELTVLPDGTEQWVARAYGPDGGCARVTSSDGHLHHIERTSAGHVARVELEGARWGIDFTRDARGRELERHLPGGIEARWERDGAGRPSRRTVHWAGGDERRSIDDRRWNWAGPDVIESIWDGRRGETQFQHDTRGRLIGARMPWGEEQVRAVDVVDNIYRTRDGSDRRYAVGGRLLEADGVVLTHDPDGNVVSKEDALGERTELDYDDAGLLREVRLPSGEEVAFTYDAFARRLTKRVRTRQGDEVEVAREVRWVWNGHTPVTEVDSDAGKTNWVFEPETFNPLAKLAEGKVWGVLCDQLGAPTELINEEGGLDWQATYDLHGNATFDQRPATDCPFRWPGQYVDEETGLHYNGFRYFDPSTDQYLSPDPAGLQGGLRGFAYVPDPLTWMDPLGDVPLGQRGYTLYHIVDPRRDGEVVYVGITNNPDAREAAHRRSGRLNDSLHFVEQESDLSYAEVRGFEQADIAFHGTRDTTRIGEDIVAGDSNRVWSYAPGRLQGDPEGPNGENVRRALAFEAHAEARHPGHAERVRRMHGGGCS